ncbi:MAG TPA: twin-arginine translocase TatA/TatE family subunit [Myxococcaceae bacterium]|nr:twin-arginine translocase TatA/TatE family subunit [Myxococcaceae bacterium]
MNMGLGEIVVLGVILTLILSASRLSRLGNALGKFVYSFRKASRGEDFVDVTPTLSRRVPKDSLPEAEQVDEPPRS